MFKKKTTNHNEEIEQKIREHKIKKYRKIGIVLGILLLIAAGLELMLALGNFQSYTVRHSAERGDSSASSFAGFQSGVLEYSNDGILYMDAEGSLIWNQAYEMTMPRLSIRDGYIAVYDQGGTDIYIMTSEGLSNHFQTGHSIRTACVGEQGNIAVLMRESGDSYVRLYDISGNELTNGEFYAKEGLIPIDIALSPDAQTLAVDMVDINNGGVDTEIDFYNFGTAGQSQVNNQIASYNYENMLIPEVEYLSSSAMVAITDSQIILFNGGKKPEAEKSIEIGQQATSVFYNNSYIGVVSSTGDEQNTHKIQVYNLNGKVVMEHDTSMAYSEIGFLENNEICVANTYSCEIYTIHSIKKFSYDFDTELYKVLYGGSTNCYIIIRNGATEQVRLR